MKANNSLSENYNEGLFPKKGSILSHVYKSFVILFIGLLSVSAMTVPTYMSFQTAMQLLEPASAAHLQSLVTDTHPTAYLIEGKISTNGKEAPITANCDAASVDMLYGNNIVLNQVELIRIKASSINDLPTSVDLIKLEELTSLKYLLVEFEYDACLGSTENCFSSILQDFLKGNSSQITVMYSHSISQ